MKVVSRWIVKRPEGYRRNTTWNLIFGYGTVLVVVTRNIFLVPVYLHYIRAEAFGAWLATGAVLSQVLITDFGLSGSIIQRTSETLGSRDQSRIGTVIGTGLLGGLVMSLVLTAVALSLARFLPNAINMSPGIAVTVVECFVIAGIANGMGIIGAVAIGILQSLQRPITAGTISLSADVLNILGTTGVP